MTLRSSRADAAESRIDPTESTVSVKVPPLAATERPGARTRIAVDSGRVEELDAEVCRLARQMHTDSYRMLELVRDFDDRFGYAKWSYKSCAEWLACRLQVSIAAAREKVRTAQALRLLPKITEAFADGFISYTKARELTRVAGKRDEELLLAHALNATAAQVAERCRQIRNVRPESTADARRAWEQRSLTATRNPARNTMLISVELPAEDGEIVLRALACAVASGEVALGVEHLAAHGEERSKTDGWCAQQADALVAMARAYLARDVGEVDDDEEPAEVGQRGDAGERGAVVNGVAVKHGDAGERGDAEEHDAIVNGVAVKHAEVRAAESNLSAENATAVAFFMSNGVAGGASPAPDGTAARQAQPRSNPSNARQRRRPRGTSVADHYQIIVHVDEKALRSWEGHAGHAGETHSAGPAGTARSPSAGIAPPRSDLPLETIRRLTCDCSLIALVEDEHGKPLGISRKNRLVSTPLRRALLARDRGCTFPG